MKWSQYIVCASVACLISGIALAESLVAGGAKIKELRTDFSFIEGPVADKDGNVFFSDIPEKKIYKWSTDGSIVLFRENSGGSNGLMFDKDWNLYACEGTVQRITSTSPDGKISVVAEMFEGKRLNSPNDLWFDANGGFYFTDPRYQFFTHPIEQDGEHVYYVSPDRKSITRVTDDVKKPNGIMGSLDGKTLYVASTAGKIFAFDIKKNAKLKNKRIFANQGSDGMTMDQHGNLYLTWAAGVTIFAPDGTKLENIEVPQMPANCGFGGKDMSTLFITARTGLYTIEMNVKGHSTAR
jgi:gluconolactonase